MYDPTVIIYTFMIGVTFGLSMYFIRWFRRPAQNFSRGDMLRMISRLEPPIWAPGTLTEREERLIELANKFSKERKVMKYTAVKGVFYNGEN